MNGQGQDPSSDDADRAAPVRGQPSATLDTGLTNEPSVPDYELLRRIGRGAYGDVWLARSKATGVLRAAKIVWRHTFEDERPYKREFEGIQRFERISREHPSQLALFHIGRNEPAGYFYYVMELADAAQVPGAECQVSGHDARREETTRLSPDTSHLSPGTYVPHTLRADLERGRLTAARVLEIGLALSEALGHLHRNGLVHRDVKPSNVIFVNGRPKLADIGLVTDASDRCSIVGTEGYLPPEGPGTPQADIFALGKVLYEAATGRDRRDFPDLPPDIRSWPDAAQIFELNEIILKACTADAGQRFQSAQEMLDDLARLAQGRSVMRHRIWRRRLQTARSVGVAAVAIVLAVVGGIFLWQTAKQRGAPVFLAGEGGEALQSHNAKAIEAYNTGLPGLLRATPDGYRRALDYFGRAIELDPKFVNAYARLFETHLLCADRGLSTPPGPAEKLAELATTLQKLAPTNADTHAAVAVVRFLNERRWNDAETEFNKALATDPNCRMALTYYGYFLTRLRKPEQARKVLERAQRLYPASPVIAKFIGHCEYAQRHFEQALFLYASVYTDLEPNYPSVHYWAGRASMAMTNYFEGARQFQEVDKLGANAASAAANYEKRQKAVDKDGSQGFWAALIAEQKTNHSHPIGIDEKAGTNCLALPQGRDEK
jgi:tetratricopeptide (TPR) repeat protein